MTGEGDGEDERRAAPGFRAAPAPRPRATPVSGLLCARPEASRGEVDSDTRTLRSPLFSSPWEAETSETCVSLLCRSAVERSRVRRRVPFGAGLTL